MFNRLFYGAVTAVSLTLAAGAASSATLGLSTSGPIDSGRDFLDTFGFGTFSAFPVFATGGPSNFFYDTVDTSLSTFDSGGDIADIVAYGYTRNSNTYLEFQLSAFDGYTNGALLTIVLADPTDYGGDPLAAIAALATDYSTAAQFSLQGIAPIPLPAGALLLGTALVGLGAVRTRRAKR